MFVIIGFVVVIGSVIGGYLWVGGHLGVLFQPSEFLIIFGAAFGSLLIGNPKRVALGTFKTFGPLLKGSKYDKNAYLELLCLLYSVFKLAKTKGDLALESHVEKPDESALFTQFPGFMGNHHTVTFFCDYLRLLTLGTNNAHEVEAIIDQEIESEHHEHHSVAAAIGQMGEAMPALGIVAAVLGVIHTMGSITEPPEVLGHLIGGALVGTFSGVLMSYGFVSPIAKNLEQTFEADSHYLHCIKAGLLAHMQGYAPQVSVEFARKILPPEVTPSFQEVEEAVSALGSPSG